MPVVFPKGRPTVLHVLERVQGGNWTPVLLADLAPAVTYKVYDGDTQVGADGSWNAADVVIDGGRAGTLWPGVTWNVQAQLAAGYVPYGGKTYQLVTEYELTGGEKMIYEDVISTRSVPGYGEPEV